TGSRIPRAPVGCWTSRGWSELHRAAILVEHRRFRRIETRGIETGCTIVPLMPWQVIAHAKAIIQSQATIYFPLILRVPLKKLDLQVHEGARAAFTVASKVPDEGVRVRIPCVSESGCEITIRAAKVERPCPVSAGGFSVSDVFKIHTGLVTVSTQVDRKIVGERRQEIIMAGFAPPIEPVDIRGRTSNTAPVCHSRDCSQAVVLGKELRLGVVQRLACQPVDHAVGRQEAFAVAP